MYKNWINNDNYFDDLAVFGLGFFHPGGMNRTREICESRNWANLKVLDVGCGIGTTIKMLSLIGAEVYGLDRSQYMIRGAELNGIPKQNLFCNDATKLPKFTNNFDVIILEGVIGFIEEPVNLIRNLTTYLDHGGEIIISDWEPHDRNITVIDDQYGFKVFGNTKIAELANRLYSKPENIRARMELDEAKSFNLSLDHSITRVCSFFNLDEIQDDHIPAIMRKLEKMKSVLQESVECISYIMVLSENELNKKIQLDENKLHN